MIFIVDDDPSVRTSLTRLLRSAGYEARAFANATEFLHELDSAGADDWNEGAVDEIVDDGSATAVGAFDGRETATGDPVVRTAPPVHAAIVRVRAMPKTASPRLAEGA